MVSVDRELYLTLQFCFLTDNLCDVRKTVGPTDKIVEVGGRRVSAAVSQSCLIPVKSGSQFLHFTADSDAQPLLWSPSRWDVSCYLSNMQFLCDSEHCSYTQHSI